MEPQLTEVRLVLNAAKTKLIMFSSGRKVPEPPPSIFSLQGCEIELMTSYKYLGIIIDDRLSLPLDYM